jgi:hypothetical protein
MSVPSSLLGILSDLYYNTGTHGSPTWVAISLVGDLKVAGKWDTTDLPIRASRAKFKQKTVLDFGVTGKLLSSLTDTAYLAVLAAMLGDTIIDVMALNGSNATNGAHGWRFDAQVVQFEEDQGPGAVVFDDFELIPVYSANAPSSVVVTTGAPVYTAF